MLSTGKRLNPKEGSVGSVALASPGPDEKTVSIAAPARELFVV